MTELKLSKIDVGDVTVRSKGASQGHKPFVMDEDAVGMLMDLLIKQYSNPVEGSFREILSNAVDATVEAGITQAVEVSLPQELDPYLTITDYGVGMSAEELDQVYRRYGNSTKRNDLNQIGAKGIGSKSPLAMAASFTVTTTQNGHTVVASVEHTVQGGCFEILFDGETELPNGTSVKIPYKSDDIKALNSYLERMTWMFPIPVLVDGVDINYVFPEGTITFEENGITYHCAPSTLQTRERNLNVCVGGIQYTVNSWMYTHVSGFNVTAELPIGSVTFPASRDNLEMSEHTKDTLRKVFDDNKWFTQLNGILTNKLSTTKTLKDAIALGGMYREYWQGTRSYKKLIKELIGSDVATCNVIKYTAGTEASGMLPSIRNKNQKYSTPEEVVNFVLYNTQQSVKYIFNISKVTMTDIKKFLLGKGENYGYVLLVSDNLYDSFDSYNFKEYEEDVKLAGHEIYKTNLANYKKAKGDTKQDVDHRNEYIFYNETIEDFEDGGSYVYLISESPSKWSNYYSRSIIPYGNNFSGFTKKYKIVMFKNQTCMRRAQKTYNLQLSTFYDTYNTWRRDYLNKYQDDIDALSAVNVNGTVYGWMIEHFFDLDTTGLNLGVLRKPYNNIKKTFKRLGIKNRADALNILTKYSKGYSTYKEKELFSGRYVLGNLEAGDFDIVIYKANKKGMVF